MNRADEAASLFSLGLAHAIEGRLEDAERALSEGITCDPDAAEGHNNLGLVLQQLGRLDEAIVSFDRAATIRPSYVLALTNLGAVYAALGQHEDAIKAYVAALSHDQRDVPALNNLGAALYTLGRSEEALEHLEVAVATDPNFADARINLGKALRACERFDDAIAQLRVASAIRPSDAAVHLQLAQLLCAADRHNEGIWHFRRSFEIDPLSAEAMEGLGQALQIVGQIEDARDCFRQAISVNPKGVAHYLSLAHITRFAPDDPAFHAMRDLADDVDALSCEDQINIHFSLGKALGDMGRSDDAFSHLLKGNAARRRQIEYDEQRTLRRFQRVKDICTAEYFSRFPGPGSLSSTPIFIVGMPRSGSTLVEQILASHPQVASAGETNAFRQALKEHAKQASDWRYPDPMFTPRQADLQSIAHRYLDLLADAAGPAGNSHVAVRATNKMLHNFRDIGLIKQIFPNSRIIHTFRDPIETCLSCFSINFASQPFAFDLGELGRYYRAYAILMRHWKQWLPDGTIFDVRYEAVAQDFERSARAIVAYCGLDWHDDCLRFYATERPVKTASVEQVRRPIYLSSVRRWRPAPELLQPLLDGLGLSATG